MAGREAGLQQGEVDPVVDLVSGSGDPKNGLAPLDLDSLAGASKALFPESIGDEKEKKVAPKTKKPSFLDLEEEEAIQLAIEQAKEDRKKQEAIQDEYEKQEDDQLSTTTKDEENPVDEYSGVSAFAADGEGKADSVASDGSADGAEAPVIFSPTSADERDDIRREEAKWTTDFEDTLGSPSVFLAQFHLLLNAHYQAQSKLYGQDGRESDGEGQHEDASTDSMLERRVEMLERVRDVAWHGLADRLVNPWHGCDTCMR